MSYGVEWMGGGVLFGFGTLLLLLIVPELAAIAVIVATIAAVVVLLAALAGLAALAAAALASPYLLVRGVRRRHDRAKKHTTDSLAERVPGAGRPADRLQVLGRAAVAANPHHEPDEAFAILEDAA